MRRLTSLSVTQLAPLLRKRDVSPVEVVEETIENLERLERRLNSHITTLAEDALRQAHTAHKEIAAGSYKGPLHGVPFGVKDNIRTNGVLTTVGSKVYAEHIPSFDAAVVEKLRTSGAILIGKHNLYEFGFGAGPNPHYGPALNPWNLDHISGGSSTGSAVAVAAHLCHVGLGSDTGGSARIPAAMCGVVGFVATRGRISNHGLFQTSRSHDRIGPMARSVEDIALAVEALSGYDARDEGSADIVWTDLAQRLKDGIRGVRILAETSSLLSSAGEVREAIERAIDILVGQGAEVMWREVPCLQWARPLHRIISVSEAAAVHEHLLRTRADDYGEKLRKRLEAGLAIRATEYLRAVEKCRHFRSEIIDVFHGCEVIVTPTVPFPAPACGVDVVESAGKHYSPFSLPVSGESMGTEPQVTDFTGPFSLVGLPAITVPCGVASGGLPIGMQLVAPQFGDAAVLRVAYAYESATAWHRQNPTIIEEAGDARKEARK